MPQQSLCQTWSTNPYVSALGVFVGTTKPPIRLLVSLNGTCRDVRRGFTESLASQIAQTGTLVTSSYKHPQLAVSVAAPDTAQDRLLRAIDASHLDAAVEELKRLQLQGVAVEPYTVEQLIEGAV